MNAHDRTGDERRIQRRQRRQRRQARQSMRLQPEGPITGATTLLLFNPNEPEQLTPRFNRRWARLCARLLASPLDRQLAHGHSPESNRLLAARAQVLVSPVMRLALSQSWKNLLAQSRTPPTMRNPRVPLNREGIISRESDICEMLNALTDPLPTPARGTAMVSCLLSDGAGPLYDRRRSAELGTALREAIAQLDPSASLQARDRSLLDQSAENRITLGSSDALHIVVPCEEPATERFRSASDVPPNSDRPIVQ